MDSSVVVVTVVFGVWDIANFAKSLGRSALAAIERAARVDRVVKLLLRVTLGAVSERDRLFLMVHPTCRVPGSCGARVAGCRGGSPRGPLARPPLARPSRYCGCPPYTAPA